MSGKSLDKILYVEDDPDIQEVAKMSLEMAGGYALLTCSSGGEALAKAAAFAPDLMLLDVMMPGMDGPTTLQALRKLDGLQSIPAVFMTAKVMPANVAEYKAMGVVDVIAKPFNPMSLPTQIEHIWEAHHAK